MNRRGFLGRLTAVLAGAKLVQEPFVPAGAELQLVMGPFDPVAAAEAAKRDVLVKLAELEIGRLQHNDIIVTNFPGQRG